MLSQESPETRPPFVPFSLARAPTQLEGCWERAFSRWDPEESEGTGMWLPTGEFGKVGGIDGGRSLG